MTFKSNVKIELRDKNGKVVKTLKKRCHSYVRQMIDVLHDEMGYAFAADIKDTGATSRTLSGSEDPFSLAANAGIDAHGIQVGTDTTAVAIDQYHLIAQILEGSTSGKLTHGSTSVGAVALVGSTAKFTISRTFTNNSGADIIVNEVALTISTSVTGWRVMIERSLLTFTISNGTSGTVTYTISVTA
jgi:hypothetical protein